MPNFFKTPPGDYMGETQGVATNSKGDIFIFFRGEHSAILAEFDRNGNFIREIGKDYYGFLFAHSVRVDSHDNIWAVDEGANLVTEFSPDGSKDTDGDRLQAQPAPPVCRCDTARSQPTGPELHPVPSDRCRLGRPRQHLRRRRLLQQPCDEVFDPDGHFLAKVGGNLPGKGNEEFNLPHALQVDRQGNVYVADRGNNRYQVFDNNLKFKASYTQFGTAWTDCISTEGDHQYLFVSNSNPNDNPPGSWAKTAQNYKMELDGTEQGKFGHAGKIARAFRWFA